MTKETLFIDPPQVVAYLRARGWRQRKSFCEEKASLWLAPAEAADVDVLLPRRKTLGDYELRMNDLLRGVAKAEGRSWTEVLQDLALVNADVLRLCVSDVDGDGITVPFRSSIKLLRSVQDIFEAAALATLEKRPFFTNRKVERVKEYIAQLRLGHTEHSSFVFTIASPLPVPEDKDEPGEAASCSTVEDPFERQVTRTLMKALEATKKAAESGKGEGILEAFQSVVKDGVSANLCDAIAHVMNMSPGRGIELSMSWAACRAKPQGVPNKVGFRKESVQIIEAAGDAFWGMSKDYDTKIEGMISALETRGREGRPVASIMGYIHGHAQMVRAAFGEEHARELMLAYDQRLLIKCEGDLIREHDQYVLKNARYFEIAGSAKAG
jgi:hypothetical protein